MSLSVTSEINLDLQNPGAPRIVHAKQGEASTRIVSIKLYNGGTAWTVPSGTTFEVSYVKPDGKGGTYSQISSDAAVVASGNALTVTLAPQALQCAGLVRCEVHMKSGTALLSTFTFFVSVQASTESGITSEDYWKAARTDKVVLLNGAVGSDTSTSVELDASNFVATPHAGDAAVGSDGYVARVVSASGTKVTIIPIGMLWVDFAGAGGAVPVPTGGTAPGRYVCVKSVDGNYRPTAWEFADAPGAICYTDEASLSHTAGVTQELNGLFFYPREPEIDELVVGKDGYTGIVTAVDDENGPTVQSTGKFIFDMSAADVGYTGTIDGDAVANVKAAIDKLVARSSGSSLIVTFAGTFNTPIANKTIAGIYAAYAAGQPVIARFNGQLFQPSKITSNSAEFRAWNDRAQLVISGMESDGKDTWAYESVRSTPRVVIALTGAADSLTISSVTKDGTAITGNANWISAINNTYLAGGIIEATWVSTTDFFHLAVTSRSANDVTLSCDNHSTATIESHGLFVIQIDNDSYSAVFFDSY